MSWTFEQKSDAIPLHKDTRIMPPHNFFHAIVAHLFPDICLV